MRNLSIAVALATALLGPPAVRADEAEVNAVKAVLAAYKASVERLDASSSVALFTEDSAVFENGASEGTFKHYLGHHLGPELKEVKSFRYSDYSVTVKVDGPYAVAAETYRFRIEPPQGDVIERQAVATSVLRKEGNAWKILQSHNSSRRPKGS